MGLSITIYFVNFLLLLVAGSILTCGWFAVTRGQLVEQVDGTFRKEGALLKGWYFFWFKEKNIKKVIRYNGKPFLDLIELFAAHPQLKTYQVSAVKNTDGTLADWQNGSIISIHANALTAEARRVIENVANGVKFAISNGFHEDLLFYNAILFKEEPSYVFPEKLRTVMAGCVTCFSSIYGSLIYWSFYLLLGRDQEYSIALVLTTWIAYMLSLAYMNTFLWKRLNK